MVAGAQGHELKRADSVAPRLKSSTAKKLAKHDQNWLMICADSEH
jgi:hypothetical protein